MPGDATEETTLDAPATRITDAEAATLKSRSAQDAVDRERVARANVRSAASRLDLLEFQEVLAKRYGLVDGDAVDTDTGEIKRKVRA